MHRTGDWSVERLIRRPGVELTDVKFSLDGRRLASCGTDRLVQIWDVEDGRELFTLLDCVAPPRRLAFSRDGDHLTATGGDRSIRVWDLAKSPFAEGSEVKGGRPAPIAVGVGCVESSKAHHRRSRTRCAFEDSTHPTPTAPGDH